MFQVVTWVCLVEAERSPASFHVEETTVSSMLEKLTALEKKLLSSRAECPDAGASAPVTEYLRLILHPLNLLRFAFTEYTLWLRASVGENKFVRRRPCGALFGPSPKAPCEATSGAPFPGPQGDVRPIRFSPGKTWLYFHLRIEC